MMLHSFLQRCKTFKMFALALLLFCAAAVQGEETVVCELSDSDCVKKGSQAHVGDAIIGSVGNYPSSEVLYTDIIQGSVDDLTWEFLQVYVKGFDTCQTTALSFDTDSSEYSWSITCDQLYAIYNFILTGSFGDMTFDGQGIGESEHNKYNINFCGNYVNTADKNGADHMTLQNTTYTITVDAPAKYKLHNMSAEQNEFLNTNWEDMDEQVCRKAMVKMLDIFINNMNSYMDYTPNSEVFSYIQSA